MRSRGLPVAGARLQSGLTGRNNFMTGLQLHACVPGTAVRGQNVKAIPPRMLRWS
jgi:hypothetical protein